MFKMCCSAFMWSTRWGKNGMKVDIADRKDSIESQTEIIDSYQNTILGIVTGMLAEANAGTANHKEKALAAG